MTKTSEVSTNAWPGERLPAFFLKLTKTKSCYSFIIIINVFKSLILWSCLTCEFFLTSKIVTAGYTAAASPVLLLQSQSTETHYGSLESPHRSCQTEANKTKEKRKYKQWFHDLAEFHWTTRWTQNCLSPASWCWGRGERACLRPRGTEWWCSSSPQSPGEPAWSGCQQSDWQALQPVPKPGRGAGCPGCHRNIETGLKSWRSGKRAGSPEKLRGRR